MERPSAEKGWWGEGAEWERQVKETKNWAKAMRY